MAEVASGGALEGIRVIELASYVSGPYAGMLLADFGAEVIKIEPPVHGDPFRGWGQVDYSATFGSVNRNKKSVVLDLKTEAGQTAAGELIDTADIVVENFRPGTLERLNLGYDKCRARNPRLIWCSITGFGNFGPRADQPGYDTVGQAMGGLLSLLTDMEAPKPMGISFADHLAGMVACNGILAALQARHLTGKASASIPRCWNPSSRSSARTRRAISRTARCPTAPPARKRRRSLPSSPADGKPFVDSSLLAEKFWRGLLKVVGRTGVEGRCAVQSAPVAAEELRYPAPGPERDFCHQGPRALADAAFGGGCSLRARSTISPKCSMTRRCRRSRCGVKVPHPTRRRRSSCCATARACRRRRCVSTNARPSSASTMKRFWAASHASEREGIMIGNRRDFCAGLLGAIGAAVRGPGRSTNDGRVLPRQALDARHGGVGRRRLRPVCAHPRQAHAEIHPRRADDRRAEHDRRRRHPGGQLSLQCRAAGRQRDRRAVAQQRSRPLLRRHQCQHPVRCPQIPLARLAAAGNRPVHPQHQDRAEIDRRAQGPRDHRQFDRA